MPPTDPVEILLVEDNVNDLELTLAALEGHSLAGRVHVARDGAEALDFVFGRNNDPTLPNPRQPKVILLDLKLPKVDGIEVLQKIKAHPQLKYTPVVVLTSSREDRDVAATYDLGVNSYIVKPVDFQEFRKAMAVLGQYWVTLNLRPDL